MSPPLAWITGAGGLIGSHLVRTVPEFVPGWRVRPLTRAELDLTDNSALRRLFLAERPAVIIHCAALSRIADCEANPALAEAINVGTTQQLADLAASAQLILLSTDLVFDGARGNYSESDAVNPLNTYAETKVRAEAAVLANPRHTVVRLSLNAGRSPTGTKSFNEDMLRAWKRGQTLNLFTDEFRNPLPAVVTARALWELALGRHTGLYHLGGAERLSRWEIGQVVGDLIAADHPKIQPRMTPASLKDYRGPRRAPDTTLDSRRLQSILSFPLPKFSEWLRQHPDEAI